MTIATPAHPDATEAHTVEVIYTFADGPQHLAHLPFFGEVSEAATLHAVLNHLSDRERQSLTKVSLCLYCANPDADPWPWLRLSGGKYYFTAVNPEEVTQ